MSGAISGETPRRVIYSEDLRWGDTGAGSSPVPKYANIIILYPVLDEKQADVGE